MPEMNAVKLQEGFDQYNAARQPGDIDLIALVREGLVMHGVDPQAIAAYDNNPLIREASAKQPRVQRWMLNRYWFCQLSALPNTMDVRLYLIQDGTEEDWIRLFGQRVLPFVAQNGLPKVI